jgi:hypothetical protein
MPHVLGNAGGPPPPTDNETLLQAEVDRLKTELDECRSVIALHQQNGCGKQLYAEGLRAELDAARKVIGLATAIYEDGNYDPVLFAELGAALAAHGKAMGGK